jgi:hypothetical protein
VVLAKPNPDKATPPVEFVQARVLRNLRLQDFQLNGFLRSAKASYPLILRTREREMVYEFTEKPLHIRVLLDPARTQVQTRPESGAPWRELSEQERGQLIFDSDVTYEDLCLDFIRWDKVISLGTDSIKTLPAWAFEATPNGLSRYAKVRYWISSDYYAFLRVDGYNEKNEVIKRVEVNGVQKIGPAYVIKEMQISTIIPGRELSSSRTYIEVRSGQPGSGL